MKWKVQLYFWLITCSSVHGVWAQSIQNVKASLLQNGVITIAYDITGGKLNQKFIIELYGSSNNFARPLNQVSGDVGKDIGGGAGKKIVWNAADELGDYKGEVSFRVKGSAMGLPFVFLSPGQGGAVRRGKQADLKWEGGTPDQTVKLELYKGADRVSAIAETKNTGVYVWSVPKDLSKGDYTVKLTAAKESVSSKTFAVKPKIPLLLKALPILVVGGVVAALGGGGGGNKQSPAVVSSDLPAAPGPK